jgi:hypothetical protein
MEVSVQFHTLASAGEKAPSTHWIGSLAGPSASLDNGEQRNFFVLAGNLTLAIQPVAYSYTDWLTKLTWLTNRNQIAETYNSSSWSASCKDLYFWKQ